MDFQPQLCLLGAGVSSQVTSGKPSARTTQLSPSQNQSKQNREQRCIVLHGKLTKVLRTDGTVLRATRLGWFLTESLVTETGGKSIHGDRTPAVLQTTGWCSVCTGSPDLMATWPSLLFAGEVVAFPCGRDCPPSRSTISKWQRPNLNLSLTDSKTL